VNVAAWVADLDDVGGLGVAGQRGGEPLDQALPLLLLDLQRRARVRGGELLHQVVAGLVRGVLPV
jgi:hypothetical protein